MKSSLTDKVIETIVTLVKKDSYTVAEMCKKAGISERSFYSWKKENAEFAEAIKKAEDEAVESRLVECKNSLNKLINGYEYDEVKTVYEQDGRRRRVKEKTITKKIVQPNLGAIIHFQTNKDPENWKNKQNIEAEVKVNPFGELMKKISERRKDGGANGDTD